MRDISQFGLPVQLILVALSALLRPFPLTPPITQRPTSQNRLDRVALAGFAELGGGHAVVGEEEFVEVG